LLPVLFTAGVFTNVVLETNRFALRRSMEQILFRQRPGKKPGNTFNEAELKIFLGFVGLPGFVDVDAFRLKKTTTGN